MAIINQRNPDIGKLIPTDGRGRKHKENLNAAKSTKPGPVPLE